ncbi:DUF1080 domain-containing protein [Akkermansiaceae bacterium]|nr:DUF1080 domain-containing protein [Akkermansiaceae bacterium]
MKITAILFALVLPLFGGEWVALFDGKTMKGWTNQGEVNWTVSDGTLTADKGKSSLLTTDKKFENYELELEFKAAIGTNSGVFLNTEAKPKNVVTDCYEINIAPPDNPFPTGSIVQHIKVEGQPERDEWRTYKLKVDKGTVTIVLDGKEVVNLKITKPRPAGYIGLQKNSGKIAFRNIRIKELK